MIPTFELTFWLSLFMLSYSYTIYPILLFILSGRFGRSVSRKDAFFPSIGVVVPVYNEEKVIENKIKNILSSDYPSDKISIWVGSDCSDDRTEEIVLGFGDPRIHLWVSKERIGKTGVLNNIAPMVDADVIFFTDANTMHHVDCFKCLAANFFDERVGGVAGHIEHATGTEEEFGENLYRKFESRQKFMEGKLHSTISAFGGSYAVRKELYRPIPSNAYSNDDVLIPMSIIRQGYRIIYEPEAVSEEDISGSMATEFSRRVRIGAGNFQAFSWLFDFLNPKWGWPWFCYLSHKVTRWFSPFFVVGATVSCAVLFFISELEIYKMIFTVGVVFLISGLCFKIIPLRISRHIYYFLIMNIALIFGFFRFFRGIRSAAWSRTERVV